MSSPTVDIIRMENARRASQQIADLQRRIREIEARLPFFPGTNISFAGTSSSSVGSHSHLPGDIKSGNLISTLNFSTQPTALIGDSITLDLILGATYSHVQHLQDVFHSAGWVSGGIISDAGGATVDVTTGAGAIRSTASAVGNLLFFDWSAATGQAITANSIRYVGVEYNAGSPQIVIRTTNNFDSLTDFLLGTVVNESGTLHIQNTPHLVGDHAGNMINRMIDTGRFARDSTSGGLILGESADANRYVTMTAGSIWEGLSEFAISAVDTNPGGGADTFDIYYDDNAGSFTKVAAQTAWDMDSYDDGSGVLATLGNNRYGVLWFYIELDGELVAMYGTSNAVSSAGAGIESPPSSVPNRIQAHALLIGRIIFRKDTTPAIDVETVFTTTFSSIIATDHGNLAGLSDDDHTQYMQDLVDDTTPQLGGDLDLNGKNIDFPTTPNISDCLDEDNMASNSAVMLATQQSIKAYIDGQTHEAALTTEQVQDIVGAMVGGASVQTFIAVTYDDPNGELDFIVPVKDEDDMVSNSAVFLATQQSIKAYVDAAGGGGLANVVEDLTPQLGGDLDLNGKNIDFPTTPNISDVLDEDTMVSNSAVKLATQQSIKAYVDSQTHGAPLTTEQVQDIVGAMVGGGSVQTLIAVTYDDPNGELDFVVDEANIDHDALTNFAANEHFTQANITTVGTIGTGVWEGTRIDESYLDTDFWKKATTYKKTHWFNPAMLTHDGNLGSMSAPDDRGGVMAAQIVRSGTTCRWFEFACFVEDAKATTVKVSIWYIRDHATPDAITVRYYSSFLNDGETMAYNLASNLTSGQTFTGNDQVRVFTITITDADLSGRGIFTWFMALEALLDSNSYLVGIAVEFTEDHAAA